MSLPPPPSIDAPCEGVLLCPLLSSSAAVYRITTTHLERRAGAREDTKFAPIPLRGASITLNSPGTTSIQVGPHTLRTSFDIVLPSHRGFRFFVSPILCRSGTPAADAASPTSGVSSVAGRDAEPDGGAGVEGGLQLAFLSAREWVCALSYAAMRITYPLSVPKDPFAAAVGATGLGESVVKAGDAVRVRDFHPSQRVIGFTPLPPASVEVVADDTRPNAGLAADSDPTAALLAPVVLQQPDAGTDVPPRWAPRSQFSTLSLAYEL